MKKLCSLVLVVILAISLVGCLSVEYKEYKIEIDKNGSGQGKIIWRNISSSTDSETEDGSADFVELIEEYLEGNAIEDENPGFKKTKKKLFMENGQLCGQIEFEFDHYEDIGLYRHHDEGPYMFILGTIDEGFVESNGEYAGENFPLIFWDSGTKEFEFVTSINQASTEESKLLIDHYKLWKETGKLPVLQESEPSGQ